MKVICIEEPAFFNLFDRVVEHFKLKSGNSEEKRLSTEDAMKKLCLISKAAHKSYRDNGDIRFTQPRKKVLLYDAKSIHDFLNKPQNALFKMEQ